MCGELGGGHHFGEERELPMRGRTLRWLLLTLAGLVVIALAEAVAIWPPLWLEPPLRITQKKLRPHPNWHDACRSRVSLDSFTGVSPVGPFTVLAWKGDTDIILFRLHRASRRKAVDDGRAGRTRTLDCLLWRAKRQWHRWFPE
jgi:hypothetical protein